MRKKTGIHTRITALVLAFAMLTAALVSCREEPEQKVYDDNYRHFYEIYVRSFSDSDGDGIGDLRGVLSKIDYLKAPDGEDDSHSLGVDAVWLMPIFTSPSQHKYDVTDYCEIDPSYGKMADFEELVAAFHERGIHIILDLAFNHTSSRHKWFKRAVNALNRGDTDDRYVKYYNFTKKPEKFNDEGYPIGYTAVPGNHDGYYYESRFVSDMPDLNFDNPDVWDELKAIMKFWLDKDVDGFRMDACKEYYTGSMKKSIEALGKMVDYGKSVKSDCYFIAEVWESAWIIEQYYASGVDSVFNFDCSYVGPYSGIYNNITTGAANMIGTRAEAHNDAIRNKNLNAIDAPFLSNHDTTRSGTYLWESPQRKMAASIYMTLPGNPFIYYGEEIGMTGGWANDPEKRLPMKWSPDESDYKIKPPSGAGTVKAPQYGALTQFDHPTSLVNHYRKLIKLKTMNPEIQRAQVVSESDLKNYNVAAYTCTYDNSSVMVIHNVTRTPKTLKIAECGYGDYSEISGFVIGDEYVEEEAFKAYMGNYEYNVPDMKPSASPVFYVNGVLTMPARTTVVLRNPGKVNATFVPTTTTTQPDVSPTDLVTSSDTSSQ